MMMHELVVYGLKQGYGQLKLISSSQQTTEVLRSGQLNTEEEEKLQLIEKVKTFSVEQLHYRPSNSYTTYYDQKNKPLLWVVTACEPYSLKAYTWKFPFLGEVSYKGFFDHTAALEEYYRLIEAGYDTDLGQVSAWSTLGFLDDPVLSGMLKKSKYRLVNLIFHELFHSTYYAPGTVEVNENLANFMAHKASLCFFTSNTGDLQEYLKMRRDDSLNTEYILHGAALLDSLYKHLPATLPEFEKKLQKKELLKKIYYQSFFIPFSYPKKFRAHHQDMFIGQNTFFMDYRRYDGMYDSLNQELLIRYNNNLGEMIQDLKTKND